MELSRQTMRRAPLWLLPCALAIIGAILWRLQFGEMFWGNWLHSRSFSVGLLSILAAIGLAAGISSKRGRVGTIVFGVLLVAYLFFFWTFIGWLILYKAIHWALIPGPTPAGM